MTTTRKPTAIAELALDPSCPNCGKEVIQRERPRGGKPSIYCNAKCRTQKMTRDAARGQVLIHLAQTWRRGRGAKSNEVSRAAHEEMVSILDMWNREDREAGRPDSAVFTAKQMVSGYRYTDRRKNRGRKSTENCDE